MLCIFPEEFAVIGNGFGCASATSEVGAESSKQERGSYPQAAVTYLSLEIGKSPIFSARRTMDVL